MENVGSTQRTFSAIRFSLDALGAMMLCVCEEGGWGVVVENEKHPRGRESDSLEASEEHGPPFATQRETLPYND